MLANTSQSSAGEEAVLLSVSQKKKSSEWCSGNKCPSLEAGDWVQSWVVSSLAGALKVKLSSLIWRPLAYFIPTHLSGCLEQGARIKEAKTWFLTSERIKYETKCNWLYHCLTLEEMWLLLWKRCGKRGQVWVLKASRVWGGMSGEHRGALR